MARKSRRPKNSKSSFSPLKKFLLLAGVIIVSATFLTYQKPQVLGIMNHIDTTPTVTPSGPTPTPSACKSPRVTKLNIDTPCDPSTRTGFRGVEYKCSDGKTGKLNKDGRSCFNVNDILSGAQKACSKNSCPTPTRAPTLTPTVTPTPTYNGPH